MESRVQIKSKRKRGRPAGKNRVPLSVEERRARNAQYERERRSENSEAMCELANAAGCDPSMPNAEILATVITFLSRASSRHPSESIKILKERNEDLLEQIADLESRLGVEFDESSSSESQDSYSNSRNSSQTSYHDDDMRTHDNDIGCKRVKTEPFSDDEAEADSEGSSLVAALDEASLARFIEDSSTSLGGNHHGLTPLGVPTFQHLRHWSIEDLITEYL